MYKIIKIDNNKYWKLLTNLNHHILLHYLLLLTVMEVLFGQLKLFLITLIILERKNSSYLLIKV
jgi:hypothetical protein